MDQNQNSTDVLKTTKFSKVDTNDDTSKSLRSLHKIPEMDVEEVAEINLPIDGGWAWIVMLASFLCNVMLDGVVLSSGFLHEELMKEFDVSKGYVALVSSLLPGFQLLAGPFSSALMNKYGFRPVACAGAIVGAVAIALSYYAPTLEVLFFTYGVLGGIGFSLVYIPSIVVIGFYFEKWRALATGIAMCGTGVGNFVFPPLYQYTVAEFGWRGTMLVQAVFVVTCLIYCLAYKPLDVTTVQTMMEEDDFEKPKEILTHSMSVKDMNDVERKNTLIGRKASVVSIAKLDKTHSGSRQLVRDDAMYTGSLARLPQYASRTSLAYHLSVTHLPAAVEEKEEQQQQNGCCKMLSSIVDTSLLSSPSFMMLACSGFLTMMGFYVPFIFAVPRATTGGMEESSALLIVSAIGVSNTISRIACGILSSFPSVSPLLLNNIAITAGGIYTFFSGVSVSSAYQFGFAAVFGVCIACFSALRSIIAVDLMGLEKLTNAFGFLMLFQGVAAIIGAPIAGILYDKTGSYDVSFYFAGGLILISALLCFPLKYVSDWEKKREEQKQNGCCA
ncbi:hypothetical protein ACFFRR_008766 [Megaselia abdita]